MTRGRDERGLATSFVLVTAAVVLLAAVGVAGLGRLLVEQRRAAAAADLSALAAAVAAQRGQDPCAAAGRMARLNAAEVVGCVAEAQTVRVSTATTVALWGRSVTFRAEATAGPR